MKPIAYGFLIFLVCSMCLGISSARADGLVINDGGTILVDGGTLDMSCQIITVNNGGTLTLGGGTIAQCLRVEVKAGGTFSKVAGKLFRCYGFLPAIYELLLLND